MNVQNAKNLTIEEGSVKTIHDKDNQLLWGAVGYDTKYAGDATQAGTPTPDAPQAINVVKGTQTITLTDGVVSDDFTVDLGSIELAKIGTHQDYIYKSGDDWYVHNDCGKNIVDGTYTWNVNNAKTNYTSYNLSSSLHFSTMPNNNTLPTGITEQFVGITPNMAYSSDTTTGFAFTTAGLLRVNVPNADFADATAVKNHFTSSPMNVYYVLDTPTDTQITDATLISQLDAIHEWLTRYGYQYGVVGTLPIIIDRTNFEL